MSEEENVITYHDRGFALRQGVRKEVLSRPDAWGKEHRVQVQWRPMPVLDLDLTMENVGKVPVVWMTIPPVSLQLDTFGGVYLLRDRIQVTGNGTSVEEPHEVDDADAPLDYGDYRAIWL